jgi:hypothetical protein
MPQTINFASATPRLSLPQLFVGQTQKEFIVNEGLARIDALLQASIEGSAATPPPMPDEGETWLVAATATDNWVGHEDKLASFQSGNWVIVEPRDGFFVYDRSAGQWILYNSGWQKCVSIAPPAAGSNIDIEARQVINELIQALNTAGILPQT